MLSPHTKLGPYEIVSQIGAGGMGEVYRARDTRLNRDVALKVLPEAFARDLQRMARFEREAKLLASLNHPNIAAIYGLEESGPIRALVMELVEGPTLADRIRSAAIPIDEALPIARQISDAVEYAHDHNVIHRDLKPANIKVTPDGTVKVLDFGLAKAMSEEVAEADMSNSPTLSMAATRQGVILGTAAYMSPEQAKGKAVDRRTDVWAFGAVLYEMLTGKQPFQGEDVTETLVAIMAKEPAFDALPAKTPPAIRNLLRRCLEKNPKRRLGHISEARILLEDVLSGAVPADVVTGARQKGLFANIRLAWSAAAVAILAGLALAAFTFLRPTPATQAVRFLVSPPEGWNVPTQTINGISPTPLALSPDGRQLAFVATDAENKTQLWVRSLDTLTARALAGTEGATLPFWSPDSRSLGFFADGRLKKIDTFGGPAITLCEAPTGFGGTWSQDGVIVFAQEGELAIQRVSAAGGEPTAVAKLAEGEINQRRPFFLPDGRHFLYYAQGGAPHSGGVFSVYVASLDSSERTYLLNADSQSLYSQGHLLFLRETTLMAQPFDAGRLALTGEAFPVAEEIQTVGANPVGTFSASENGVLAYQTGESLSGSQLTWFDRTGKQLGVLGDAAASSDVQLSPDGKQASVSILDPARRTRDIWIYDVTRNLRTRLTFDPADELVLAWSPDGKTVAFNSRRKGHLDLYRRAADGTGTEELLLEDNFNKYPMGFGPDGQSLVYVSSGGPTGNDLFVLPLSADRKPMPFLNSQFSEAPGQFSPDGRWLAYQSNESGMPEVYVVPFPGPGGKRQISASGGSRPRWGRDGAELFYLSPDSTLMVAAVNGRGSAFEVGAVSPLFQMRTSSLRSEYDVSPDGQRFLVNTLPEQTSDVPITVVLNWTVGLEK
jgi:eukaryotic-like serine/threonine-protein kinase